jgi:hypothetical protein
MAREIRDVFLNSPAWTILKDREPNWEFVVDGDGNKKEWTKPSQF